MSSMHVLSAGGFFHDLNFSYINTENTDTLLSVEEERFSGVKSHSILNTSVKTKYLSLDYIASRSGISLDQIDVLLLSDERRPACYDDLISLMPNAKVVYGQHYHVYSNDSVVLISRSLEFKTDILLFSR